MTPGRLVADALPWTALRRRLHAPTYIFAAFLGLSLALRFASPYTYLTADESTWMQRTFRFGAALNRRDWHGTYRVGHPGVTLMWIGLAGVGPRRLERFQDDRYIISSTVERADGYLDTLADARTAVGVVTAMLMALVAAMAVRLLGTGPGILGGLLLVLDPYVLGSSQLLHVDALLAPLMAVAGLAALIYWRDEGGWQHLLLSAIAAGLALLTKAPAAFVAAYVCALALSARSGRAAWRPLRALLLWIALVAIVYFSLWPALWLDPIGRLREVADFALALGGEPHYLSNFFLGQVRPDPGPLYYPLALAYRLGPIASISLASLVGCLALGKIRNKHVFWLLGYAIIFVVLMTFGAKKFDRYLLPAIVVFDLLAGVGLWGLLGAVRRPIAAPLVVLAALSVQGVFLWQKFPYTVAAYNPLLGGTAAAERVLLTGWGEGLEQAAFYLNRRPGAERLAATTLYDDVLRPFFHGTTLGLSDSDDPGLPSRYDYFVLYINMAQRQIIPRRVEQAMQAGPPEFTAYVHGQEYAWVYRIPRSTP